MFFNKFRLPLIAILFTVLWGSLLASLLLITLVIRGNIKSQVQTDLADAMQGFLQLNSIHISSANTIGRSGDYELSRLAFVRIVTPREQLLLVKGDHADIRFKGVVDLAPGYSGIWIDLDSPLHSGKWAVLSRSFGAEIIVQAGLDSGQSLQLVQKTVKIVSWLAVAGILGCWFVAWLLARLASSPIRHMQRDLETVRQRGGREMFAPMTSSGQELTIIYDQLNKLFEQNRQLVVEMQESLDNVAHDLRTPMTRLRAVAEYALQAEPDLAGYREALADCLEESERLLAMLRVMMSVAEAESGIMVIEAVDFDLAESLAEIVNLYEYVAEEKEIGLQLNVQPGTIINCDRVRFGQVWANLVDNAIKYGKQGGRVRIYAEFKKEWLDICFQDDGMGISENEIDRIWDRLYRGDRSRSCSGLGLGLNYVRAVVQAHSGKVSVHSTLHKGSVFTVRLALASVT